MLWEAGVGGDVVSFSLFVVRGRAWVAAKALCKRPWAAGKVQNSEEDIAYDVAVTGD